MEANSFGLDVFCFFRFQAAFFYFFFQIQHVSFSGEQQKDFVEKVGPPDSNHLAKHFNLAYVCNLDESGDFLMDSSHAIHVWYICLSLLDF